MFYGFTLRVLTWDGSGFLKTITSPPLPLIRTLLGPSRAVLQGDFRSPQFPLPRPSRTSFSCALNCETRFFFLAPLRTEWQLGRRVAHQECPAEARRPLHLHSTDARRQRDCLRPAGGQG